MRDAGSHHCDAEDHSGPLDPKDEGTAMVRNVCDHCQSTRRNIRHTWIYVDLHLQTDISFPSSGFISEYTTLPLLVYLQRKTTKPRDKPYTTWRSSIGVSVPLTASTHSKRALVSQELCTSAKFQRIHVSNFLTFVEY